MTDNKIPAKDNVMSHIKLVKYIINIFYSRFLSRDSYRGPFRIRPIEADLYIAAFGTKQDFVQGQWLIRVHGNDNQSSTVKTDDGWNVLMSPRYWTGAIICKLLVSTGRTHPFVSRDVMCVIAWFICMTAYFLIPLNPLSTIISIIGIIFREFHTRDRIIFNSYVYITNRYSKSCVQLKCRLFIVFTRYCIG